MIDDLKNLFEDEDVYGNGNNGNGENGYHSSQVGTKLQSQLGRRRTIPASQLDLSKQGQAYFGTAAGEYG